MMIRTQIQLPDALYREVKRVAAEREMSLAELRIFKDSASKKCEIP
jgi:predicted DNA-binding ribbon-helix-helix protein